MAQIRDKKLLRQIAVAIKHLRDRKGVTQEIAYLDTNVHIGRIETAASNLTISTLAVLLEYFEISFSEFFRQIEQQEK
jgi:transcriptional regulator with XRE-family HTH domain